MTFPRGLTLEEKDRPVRSPGKLVKTLEGTCTFPDGTDGTWAYERLGPACHRYDYRYGDGAAIHTEETQRGLAVKLLRPALRPAMRHLHQRWADGLARIAEGGTP